MSGQTNWKFYFASFKFLPLRGAPSGNPPLWYLSALFLIHNFYNYVRRWMSPYFLLCISAIIPTFMYYAQMYEFRLLAHTSAGLFFFTLGNITSSTPHWLTKVKIHTWLILFIIMICINPVYVDFYPNKLEQGCWYPLWFVTYFLASVIFTQLFRCISEKISMDNWILTQLGKDSMTWLVTHWILLSVCKIVVLDICSIENNVVLAITMTIVCATVIPFLVRLFNKPRFCWMVGKKV